MLSDQMTAILALLGDDDTGDRRAGLLPTAAAAAASALGVDGICAGVGAGPEGVVLAWGQEETSAALEDAQFTLGQGPSLAAIADGAPVLVPDLLNAPARWPAFTPAAVDLGVRAVFAFPLRVGAISVGMLLAHRNARGPLHDGQLADALGLADAVTALLLHRELSGPVSEPVPGAMSRLAPGAVFKPAPGPMFDRASDSVFDHAPAEGNRPRPGWSALATHRAEVHQATGMIAFQLGVPLAEALVRLRAHAYANDRLVNEVAADVVGRRLRFDHRTST